MVGDIAGIVKLCAARWAGAEENVLRVCGWEGEQWDVIWRASSRTDCLPAMAADVEDGNRVEMRWV